MLAQLTGEVYLQPKSEAERQRSFHALFAVLEAERLAPCSADDFLAARKPPTALVRPPLYSGGDVLSGPVSSRAIRNGAVGGSVPLPGGPAGGVELETEMLTIILVATYQRCVGCSHAAHAADFRRS